jgi:Flp pilus assembly protein TadG
MNAKRAWTTLCMQSRDCKGAVYVEFLIAFLPILVLFSGLFQLGVAQTADLVTQHAAVTAARAAMVVLPDDPQYYDGIPENHIQGARLDDITSAAAMSLSAIDSAPRVQVNIPSKPGGTDNRPVVGEHDIVITQVKYTFPCRVPIGNLLVCGFGGEKTLTAEAAMPNQGTNESYQ